MNDARRTLVLITRNLPPLRGGMERLNLHIALGLADHFHVVVIGPRGARAALPPSVDVRECGSGSLGPFLFAAWFSAIRVAREVSPAWVVAGSGLTAPLAWMAASLSGARFAAYVHGLDLVVRHAVYRALWLPFVRRVDLCIANSFNTAKLAQQAGVPAQRVQVVHPGVAFPDRMPSVQVITAFRRRHGIEGRPVLLSVGRMTERKGLREFVMTAMPSILRVHPDAVLMVIGDEAPDALAGSASGAWARLLDEAKGAGLGDALLHLGALGDDQLAVAYASSDVHVFPIRDVPGDVEGFGMVAIEAAAYGLPTVAFAVGGVPDAVSDQVTGYLVANGDYGTFAQQVTRILDGERFSSEAVTAFARSFAWPEFNRRLLTVLDSAGAI